MRGSWPIAAIASVSCGIPARADTSGAAEDALDAGAATSTDGIRPTTGVDDSGTASADDAGDRDACSDGGPKLDVGFDDDGDVRGCRPGEMPGSKHPCNYEAPADSFEPEVQWSWTAWGAESSVSTPLVINLTDDNGDGEIDLCDIPDVVIVAYPGGQGARLRTDGGRIHVLDGATGALHFTIPEPVHAFHTPAVGDIDGDGLPEIVTVKPLELSSGTSRDLMVFEHDGVFKLKSSTKWQFAMGSALGLADVDNDGDVEIYHQAAIYDHEGQRVAALPDDGLNQNIDWMAVVAVDLDGDGDLEIVRGRDAVHHDGTYYYYHQDFGQSLPSIANLDADPEPEIVLTGVHGITVLEHDGTIKFQDEKPTGVGAFIPCPSAPNGCSAWYRPSTVHDFDGDGLAEFATSSAQFYSVYKADPLSIVWSAEVAELSGSAAGTAFDFLGDGTAEAMYADETLLWAFNAAGQPLLAVPRTSGTQIEYPVVADVDNDGSAEIIVVSNDMLDPTTPSPTVQVIHDAQDRWVPARRIWNQHTYHVTNVNEDGTIPQVETPHWSLLNTFRTQAQIDARGGGVCRPEG